MTHDAFPYDLSHRYSAGLLDVCNFVMCSLHGTNGGHLSEGQLIDVERWLDNAVKKWRPSSLRMQAYEDAVKQMAIAARDAVRVELVARNQYA